MKNDKKKVLLNMIDIWMLQLNDDRENPISKLQEDNKNTKGKENGK